MAINRVKKRGQSRIEVRRRWPDGTTYRRFFPNMTTARQVNARIEGSIATGHWEAVREELTGNSNGRSLVTVADFAEVYLGDYCQARNKDVGFKERSVAHIVRLVGDVPLKELGRRHAHQFVADRSREVSAATVNRNLAVLKNMLTFALEREQIDVHPLSRFRSLPEERSALRPLAIEEERALVESVARVDPVVGVYVALLGETGLRKQEGLRLKWSQIDQRKRMLAVENTKSKRPRYVPLSDYAMEWLGRLVRFVGRPHVFVNPATMDRIKDPRGSFDKGKRAAALGWVTFHDLRHFRATQWVAAGVDLRTVKELLGHSSIQTTMRYAHFAPAAFETVRRIQNRETGGRHLGDGAAGAADGPKEGFG